jgi:hypothetical protein
LRTIGNLGPKIYFLDIDDNELTDEQEEEKIEHGQSVTIGKIIFLSNGKPIISIDGISDPQGLRRLVLSIKKALYPKKELQCWMTGIRSDDTSVIHNTSICLRCGERNIKDASFCSKCGSILK